MNKVMEHKVNRKDTTTAVNLNFGKISPCNSRGFFMQKTKHKVIRKGDVWIVDNANAVGHMQKGLRPHVVVTQVTGETVTVAPCTSAPKKNHQYVLKILPTEQNGLTMISYVLCPNPSLQTRASCERKYTISMKTKSHAFNLSL